jgi:hypothetical protein
MAWPPSAGDPTDGTSEEDPGCDQGAGGAVADEEADPNTSQEDQPGDTVEVAASNGLRAEGDAHGAEHLDEAEGTDAPVAGDAGQGEGEPAGLEAEGSGGVDRTVVEQSVAAQISYYLSDKNLPWDFAVLKEADERCWIPLPFMVNGFKIKRMLAPIVETEDDRLPICIAAIQNHSPDLVCREIDGVLKIRRRVQLDQALLHEARHTLETGFGGDSPSPAASTKGTSWDYQPNYQQPYYPPPYYYPPYAGGQYVQPRGRGATKGTKAKGKGRGSQRWVPGNYIIDSYP